MAANTEGHLGAWVVENDDFNFELIPAAWLQGRMATGRLPFYKTNGNFPKNDM